MKKILSVILVMLMVLSMTACGSKDKASDGSGSDQAETIVLGQVHRRI